MTSTRVALGGLLLLALATGLPACRMTNHFPIREPHSDSEWCGDEFVQSTAIGLHFIMLLPLFGDGSLRSAFEEFQDEADAAHTLRIRVVDNDTSVYWWWLPPLSFLLPLVISSVSGDFDLPTAPDDAAVEAPDAEARAAEASAAGE